jgi:hypothetical protein
VLVWLIIGLQTTVVKAMAPTTKHSVLKIRKFTSNHCKENAGNPALCYLQAFSERHTIPACLKQAWTE